MNRVAVFSVNESKYSWWCVTRLYKSDVEYRNDIIIHVNHYIRYLRFLFILVLTVRVKRSLVSSTETDRVRHFRLFTARYWVESVMSFWAQFGFMESPGCSAYIWRRIIDILRSIRWETNDLHSQYYESFICYGRCASLVNEFFKQPTSMDYKEGTFTNMVY